MSLDGADASDWLYRAEGNKNLTIANLKKGSILRILKESRTTPQGLPEGVNRKIHDEYERLIGYQKNVMSAICGCYMGEMHLARVDEEFLTQIGEQVEPWRAREYSERCGKRISMSTEVIVMPDYAFIPKSAHLYVPKWKLSHPRSTYCFGLKLKHLKNLSKVNSLSPCQQFPQCITCIDRYLEHLEIPGDDPVSQFCPCELISGDFDVATSAIRQLITDFNSFKNRLDFCKNGIQKPLDRYEDVWDLLSEIEEYKDRITEGEGRECLTELSEILYKALYHSPKYSAIGSWKLSPQYITDYLTKSSPLPCPQGCVLDVLVHAHQLAADVDTVERAYIQLTEAIEEQPDIATKLCLYGPYDNEMWCLTTQPSTPHGISQNVMNSFIVVRNYLVCCTITDSSILISLQYLPRSSVPPLLDSPPSTFVINLKNRDILCNVALIDFDPKPYTKMKAYIDKRKKILKAARRFDANHINSVRGLIE